MGKHSAIRPTKVSDVTTGHRNAFESLVFKLMTLAGGVSFFFILGVLQILASACTFARSLLGDKLIDDMQSKYVAISGCDTGFGRMLALRLARSGMTVFAGCMNGDHLESLKQEYPESNLFAYLLNVKSQESVKAFSAKVKAELGDNGLWAVVNNAGILGPICDDEYLSVHDYVETADVNFFGAVRFTHALRPLLNQRAEGRIVFMLSLVSYQHHPYAGPYTASKTALLGYVRTLRSELSTTNTWVITLSPGYYSGTQLHAKQYERTSQRLDAVKDEGKDAVKKRQSFMAMHSKLFVGPNKLSHVVDAQTHAIIARYPKNDYFTGWTWLYSKIEGCLSETATVWLLYLYRHCAGDAV